MKQFLTLVLIVVCSTSCVWMGNKKIKGNGMLSTELRSVGATKKIKIAGSINAEITQSTANTVEVKADANLIPYIKTENEDGWLVINTKKGYNLRSDNPIIIVVNTDLLEAVTIAGNGDVKSINKITGGEQLKIKIAGNGNVNLAVNTPKVNATIAGNGNIVLEGETKDAAVDIAGNGDFKAKDLKSENAKVKIAGMGNVYVFASNTLDIHIAGSGDVHYAGNPVVTKKVAGSGTIQPIQ